VGDIGRQDALTGVPVARGGRLDSARFEALRARMQAASAAPSQLRAHPRAADGEPCSCEQARAWFLEQWEGSSALYQVVSRWRLDGTLDEAALQQALDALVARHESLRTGFPAIDGEPVQRIAAVARCPLERIAAADADAHARRPFDLEQPPLLRAALWRGEDGAQRLQLVTHHIVSDGWSQGVLQREVGALYAAALRGGDAGLPALPVQYADFARWQRERLQGSSYDALLGYWRDALAGLPQLALPTDRARRSRTITAPRWTSVSTPHSPARCARSPAATAARSTWCCWPPSSCCWRAGADRTTSSSARRWPVAASPNSTT
jgi:hypothetical protein